MADAQVSIKVVSSVEEAELALSFLRVNGIPCAYRASPGFTIARDGLPNEAYAIVVARDDVAAARELLSETDAAG